MKESEDIISQRKVSAKKGDVLCIWMQKETGREEFCGYFDKQGRKTVPNNTDLTVPESISKNIKAWHKRFNSV
ncbi:MAG: hypothetical protein FWH37_07220 [Candidatus Bathyarchaeota archaeon]|nr:hypothetical protein [Candidatus Termiticorpusculum sp.]